MAKNEVELIIRARNESAKAFAETKAAFKDFIEGAKSVNSATDKAGSSVAELGRIASTLKDRLSGLSALGRIAENVENASGAVDRLKSTVATSASEFAKLARETDAAAKSALNFKAQIESEIQAQKSAAASRRETNNELRAANKELKAAERNQLVYNKTLAATPETKLAPAVRSAGAFVASDLEKARSKQQQLTQAVREYDTEIARSKNATSVLTPQLRAAAENQTRLERQTEKASVALNRNREALDGVRRESSSIGGVADQASKALGGMAITQQNVANASAKMAAQIANAKAKIDALNAASKPVSSGSDISSDTKDVGARRAAIERLREVQKELVAAQASARNLNQAFTTAVAPTEQMGAAAGNASAKVRLLKAELNDLRTRLREGTGGFREFSIAAGRMGTSAPSINAYLNSLRPIAPLAQRSADALNQGARGSKNFSDGLKNIEAQGRTALSFTQRLRAELLGLAAAYGGFNGIITGLGNVVGAFQKLEAAQNRLGAVFEQNTSRVGSELAFLQRQAERLGISFEVLSDQYSKFAIAAKTANFSAQSTRDIFLSVAEAGRVNKLSVDNLNGVFLALEQMISKGRVSSEELRRQLGDRLPGAFSIFAKAIGVTTAELDAMLRKGDVIADQDTLLKFAAELDRRFGPQLSQSLKATTTEIGRFSNNLYQAQLQIAAGGFIDAFTESLRKLNEYFKSREGRDFFLSIGAAAGKLMQALGLIPEYFDEIKIALTAIVAIKIGNVFLNLIGTMKTLQSTSGATAQSLFTWSGNMQALQGRMSVFRNSVSPLSVAFNSLRQNIVAAALAGQMAGTRFVAMQAGLATLRGAAALTAGAFRVLWSAIGGLPGLILTGITLAIGQWATAVDDTTRGLDEHQRVMGEVISAYDAVKGKTQEWAKEIKNVTTDQLAADLRFMLNQIKTLRDEASKIKPTIIIGRAGTDEGRAQIAQLDELNESFKKGEINAQALALKIRELYKSLSDTQAQKYAEDLLESADKTAHLERETGALALALKGQGVQFENLEDIIEQTGASMDKLSDAQDDSANSSAKMFENSERLSDILGEIDKLLPGIADQLDRIGKIDAFEKQFREAEKYARTLSEAIGIADKFAKAETGLIDKNFDDNSSLVDRIIGAESSGNATAKNPNSSATGLGQFISETWLRMFKQYFPDRAAGMTNAMILELRKSETVSRQMVALYVQENAAILKKAGVALTDANLYLAHFLGPGGAIKVATAPRGTKAEDILSPGQIDVNKSVLQNKTVEEIVAWAQKKVGASQEELAIEKAINEENAKKVEKAKEYNSDLENRLTLQANENANAGKLNEDGFVQKALADEQRRAREAGVTLTAQQIEQIKALAAEEFKLVQAKRDGVSARKEDAEAIAAANLATQQASALETQRAEIIRQLKDAQKASDSGLIESLGGQLESVNLKLSEAIDKASAMWEAIGGPSAAAKLPTIEALKQKLKDAENQIEVLGKKSVVTGQQINEMLASGITNAFDKFAQAIANGEDAATAFRNAFLQMAADFLRQIALMIIKQTILNALQAGGGANGGIGGMIAKALTSVLHTGGVAGRDGARRMLSPSMFANAARYHTGGVAGLKPGELPAVLKRGEIIDPGDGSVAEKVFGTGRNSKASQSPLSIRNVLVFDENTVGQMLGSATGERVTVAHIKKNIDTIKAMVNR